MLQEEHLSIDGMFNIFHLLSEWTETSGFVYKVPSASTNLQTEWYLIENIWFRCGSFWQAAVMRR